MLVGLHDTTVVNGYSESSGDKQRGCENGTHKCVDREMIPPDSGKCIVRK